MHLIVASTSQLMINLLSKEPVTHRVVLSIVKFVDSSTFFGKTVG